MRITGLAGEKPGAVDSLFKYGQVRSGQVRSECLMCTFRASCCSARLSRFHCPGQVCELQEMVYMQHL